MTRRHQTGLCGIALAAWLTLTLTTPLTAVADAPIGDCSLSPSDLTADDTNATFVERDARGCIVRLHASGVKVFDSYPEPASTAELSGYLFTSHMRSDTEAEASQAQIEDGNICSVWDLDITVAPRVGGRIQANYWEYLVFEAPPRMISIDVTVHSQHIEDDGSPSDFWQETQTITANNQTFPGAFPTSWFGPRAVLDRPVRWRGNWRTKLKAPSPTMLTDGSRCVLEEDHLMGHYRVT